MFNRTVNRKDLGAGVFFILVGVVYATIALRTLPMGRLLNMGPGFFPLMLCTLLVLIGGGLVGRSLLAGASVRLDATSWRAMSVISAALASFALLLAPLGLAIAVFAATFIASFAARGSKLVPSLLAALGLSVFCVVVFIFGARMQAPLFGSWFGF